MRATLVWAQSDDFWRANILSATKLRKQYDQLRAHMARSSGTSAKPAGPKPSPLPILADGRGKELPDVA